MNLNVKKAGVANIGSECLDCSWDETGEFFACGCANGRGWIFQESLEHKYRPVLRYFIQSPEFDPVRGIKLSRMVNALCFLSRSNYQFSLLTSTPDQIKRWTFRLKNEVVNNCWHSNSTISAPVDIVSPLETKPLLNIPHFPTADQIHRKLTTKLKRVYYPIQMSSIHSLSLSYDKLTFLNSDDYSVNIFSTEFDDIPVTIYNINAFADMPSYLTKAAFHDSQSSLFATGNVGGLVSLFDMRDGSKPDAYLHMKVPHEITGIMSSFPISDLNWLEILSLFVIF